MDAVGIRLEGIPVAPFVEKLQGNGNGDQQESQNHGSVIKACKAPFPIPGTFWFFAEAAQLHGVGYDFDPLHAGEDEGHQNGGGPFETFYQVFLAGQLHAPCLLCQGNCVKFVQDVRNIAQSQGDRVGHLVAYADLI